MDKYIYKTKLKERGWTDDAIRRFLGEPDLIKPNPFYRTAPPSQLYLIERVEDVEKSANYIEWYQKTLDTRKKISSHAKKNADLKREELLKYVDSLNIRIKRYSTKESLYSDAIRHYNALWESRDELDKVVVNASECSEEFLNRIATNMLRHTSKQYEPQLEKFVNKVGRDQAYDLLRSNIDQKIMELYPFLQLTEI